MIASGTDIAIVAKRLGHSSVSITADLYAQLIGSASCQAGEKCCRRGVPKNSQCTRSARPRRKTGRGGEYEKPRISMNTGLSLVGLTRFELATP
jgi:hypothetical protein